MRMEGRLPCSPGQAPAPPQSQGTSLWAVTSTPKGMLLFPAGIGTHCLAQSRSHLPPQGTGSLSRGRAVAGCCRAYAVSP